jgi:thiol-disulfide isomerase/thioredoxin
MRSCLRPASLRSWLLLLLSLTPSLTAALEEEGAGLSIGDRAVDFSLPGVDGKTYTLADFADAKLLAVVFTCNHCPTAQAYEERLAKLVAEYRDKGVAFVAISPNDPEAVRLDELGYTDVGDSLEDMSVRAKERGFRFPYLYDGETQATSRAYGPLVTPHVFLFDAERKLRFSGRIDDTESGKDILTHDTRRALDALLAGEPVAVEKTRVFGCSVKWSDKREANRRFLEKLAAEDVTLEPTDAGAVAALRRNDSKKLRMINVWATTCRPCMVELPDHVETNRMYRHRDFEFVTISIDPDGARTVALEALKKFQASNRNLIYSSEDRDALAEALDKEWSGTLPLTLLVKPGGQVLWRHEGQVAPLTVRRKIVGHLGRTYHR